MARPSIPEERYEQAINQMLADGLKLEQVTATRLQAVVGGRYDRAAKLLKDYQKAHTSTQQADTPEKPEWFDSFQQALISQTDKLWSDIVSPEIQRRYDLAAKEAEKARNESELNRTDDLKQITVLEDRNEQQEEANEQMSREIDDMKLQLTSEQAKREQIERQLTELQNELTSERRRSSRAEATSEQQEKQIIELKSQITTASERQQQTASELATSQQASSKLSGQLEAVQEQQKQLREELTRVQCELDSERRKCAQLEAMNPKERKGDITQNK